MASTPRLASTSPTRSPTNHRDIAILIFIGTVFRLATVPLTIVHQPDEIWQYLEPAYGLVTGRWIQTWEFHEGIRSFLLPFLLVPEVAMGLILSPHGQAHVVLAQLAMVALSLSAVPAAYVVAEPLGRPHAIIAGFVAATWFELIYFSARTSSDGVALSLIFLLVFLVSRTSAGRSTHFATGLILALCFSIRLQLAPALLLIAVWAWHRSGERIPRYLLGGLIGGAIVSALADLAAGQVPFLWVLRNFTQNYLHDRASQFGVLPPWWYLIFQARMWSWGTIVIVPLALAGARRLPFLALIAAVIVATHSLVPHKEYRFVIVADELIVLLAAIGSGEIVRCIHWPAPRRAVAFAICGAWLAVSGATAVAAILREDLSTSAAFYRAYRQAGSIPGLCGIAEYRPVSLPLATYVALNRAVPIYLLIGPDARHDLEVASSSFDVIITPAPYRTDLPRQYDFSGCSQPYRATRPRKYCIFVRAGGCSGSSTRLDYNRRLTQLGH